MSNSLMHVVQMVKADFNLLESYTSANGILFFLSSFGNISLN